MTDCGLREREGEGEKKEIGANELEWWLGLLAPGTRCKVRTVLLSIDLRKVFPVMPNASRTVQFWEHRERTSLFRVFALMHQHNSV